MRNLELARKTLKQLEEYYPPGLYEWLFKYNKSLYKEITKVENDLDRVISNGTEEETKKLLRKYWKLHKTAIVEFRNNKFNESDINYAEIRKEMLEVKEYKNTPVLL